MIRLVQIESIDSFDYEGEVFNIELETNDENIENDDLFWIDDDSGIVTHNCLVKDLNAIVSLAKDLGVNPTILEASWKKNLEVRPEKDHDWNRMVGRAVSED